MRSSDARPLPARLQLASWHALQLHELLDQHLAEVLISSAFEQQQVGLDQANARVAGRASALGLLALGVFATAALPGLPVWARILIGLAGLCALIDSARVAQRYTPVHRRPTRAALARQMELLEADRDTLAELRERAAGATEIRPLLARWLLSGLPVRQRDVRAIDRYLVERRAASDQ